VSEAPALEDRMLIVMGHSDIYHITNLMNEGERGCLRDRWLPRLRSTGQGVVFAAVSGDQLSHLNGSQRPLAAAMEQWDMFLNELQVAGDSVRVIRDAGDIPDRRDDTRTSFVLALEGGRPLESSLANLRNFYRLGLRSIQLTHDLRNELGDGRNENVTGGGLSRFGRAVVREANRLGIVLDVSHIGDASFYDVLEESTSPVVATHSNARAVFEHPRNFTDEQIKLIAGSGGVLNLVYIPRFIGHQYEPIEGVMAHLRHVVDLVGIDHVGIGGLGTDSEQIEMFGNAGWPFERLARVLAERPKDVKTGAQVTKMVDALRGSGFAENDIRKIFGGNLLRVLRTVLSENKRGSAGGE